MNDAVANRTEGVTSMIQKRIDRIEFKKIFIFPRAHFQKYMKVYEKYYIQDNRCDVHTLYIQKVNTNNYI